MTGFCSETYDYNDDGISHCVLLKGHQGWHLDAYEYRWVDEVTWDDIIDTRALPIIGEDQ